MMRSERLWLLSLLLFFSTTTLAQLPIPTDTELRAAYCVKVIQSDIKGFNDLRAWYPSVIDSAKKDESLPADLRQETLAMLEKQQADLPQKIAEKESVLNRLQLFVLPRMQYLDASTLLAAISRADSDMEEWSRLTGTCLRECKSNKAGMIEACLSKCSSGDLEKRLTACRNPTWLPF